MPIAFETSRPGRPVQLCAGLPLVGSLRIGRDNASPFTAGPSLGEHGRHRGFATVPCVLAHRGGRPRTTKEDREEMEIFKVSIGTDDRDVYFLGADDPEMQGIEDTLSRLGLKYFHARANGL